MGVVVDGGKLDATSQRVTRQVTRYAIARDLVEVDRQWHTPLTLLWNNLTVQANRLPQQPRTLGRAA